MLSKTSLRRTHDSKRWHFHLNFIRLLSCYLLISFSLYPYLYKGFLQLRVNVNEHVFFKIAFCYFIKNYLRKEQKIDKKIYESHKILKCY